MTKAKESVGISGEWFTGRCGNLPGQGPFMEVSLSLARGVIAGAKYETFQCSACHACGKAICRRVQGRTPEEARSITWDLLVREVGEPLPRGKRHCYGLALLALEDALNRLERK